MTRNKTRVTLFLGALALIASTALAGPLADDTNSYQGTWNGTTAFANGTLTGTVDWAVYGPNAFPVGFLGNTYTPTPNEFVYTYQVYVDGDDVSSLSIDLANPADNIGFFTGSNGFGTIDNIGSDDPFYFEIVPLDNANWLFDGIAPGRSSVGLAFSSEFIPMWVEGTVLDGGNSDDFFPVPSPDSVLIPEPSSLVLLACGLMACGMGWLRRRRHIAEA